MPHNTFNLKSRLWLRSLIGSEKVTKQSGTNQRIASVSQLHKMKIKNVYTPSIYFLSKSQLIKLSVGMCTTQQVSLELVISGNPEWTQISMSFLLIISMQYVRVCGTVCVYICRAISEGACESVSIHAGFAFVYVDECPVYVDQIGTVRCSRWTQ